MLLSAVGLLLRGERTGHRQPLRLWDGKEQSSEAQNWHHNSTRSFHDRGGPPSGYPTGPAERYANWDNIAGNSLVRPAAPRQRHFQRVVDVTLSVSSYVMFFFSCRPLARGVSPASQQQRTPVPTREMGPFGLQKELFRQNCKQQTRTMETAGPPPAARPSASPRFPSTAPSIPEGRMFIQEEEGPPPRSGGVCRL